MTRIMGECMCKRKVNCAPKSSNTRVQKVGIGRSKVVVYSIDKDMKAILQAGQLFFVG